MVAMVDALHSGYMKLATNFKERYRNHKTSFRHSKRRNETELSKYVWNLQNENKPFQIKWKILKKCKSYSNINKKCSLCLNEKFIIICKKELCSLNRRNELASSCPHRNRYVLGNFRVTQLKTRLYHIFYDDRLSLLYNVFVTQQPSQQFHIT